MNTGLRLADNLEIEIKLTVWNRAKLNNALQDITGRDKLKLDSKIATLEGGLDLTKIETLQLIEEISGFSYSTQIPIHLPETLKAIVTAFENEADISICYHLEGVLNTAQSSGTLWEGKEIPISVWDKLSTVRRGEIISVPQLTLMQQLEEDFKTIFHAYCKLLPKRGGTISITPKFEVCCQGLDEVISVSLLSDIENAIAQHDLRIELDGREVGGSGDIFDWIKENTNLAERMVSSAKLQRTPTKPAITFVTRTS